MNGSGYVDDENLFLYALQALSPAEHAAVAADLAVDRALQQRIAEILDTLGAYAAATVDPVEPPAGCLERLERAIALEPRPARLSAVAPVAEPVSIPTGVPISAAPTPVEPAVRRPVPIRNAPSAVLPWAGWVIAAVLLLTAGWQLLENRRLQHSVESGSAQLAAVRQSSEELARQRDNLQNRAQQEAGRADTAATAAAELSNRSAELSQQVDAASSRAEQESRRAAQLSARVNAEANRAARESGRAADLAAEAAATAGQRDQLQNALQQQGSQLAQQSAQSVEARQVLDALSDPTALRATLTVPKQKKTPSGRGTYVPSRGTLLFAGSNLPPLTGGKVYELWLMPTDGSAPIPAGTFSPDATGNATLISTRFRTGIAAKGFAITAEPAGGSQKPTLPILLAAL